MGGLKDRELQRKGRGSLREGEGWRGLGGGTELGYTGEGRLELKAPGGWRLGEPERKAGIRGVGTRCARLIIIVE